MDDIFNNFIKGFGVLTEYAEKRLTQATGVGGDKISTALPQGLREAAGIYERYTIELAKASEYLLRKHGKSIADRQHDLKRIADIGIDLSAYPSCHAQLESPTSRTKKVCKPPAWRASLLSRPSGGWRTPCGESRAMKTRSWTAWPGSCWTKDVIPGM